MIEPAQPIGGEIEDLKRRRIYGKEGQMGVSSHKVREAVRKSGQEVNPG